jgi:hypothetical protein
MKKTMMMTKSITSSTSSSTIVDITAPPTS